MIDLFSFIDLTNPQWWVAIGTLLLAIATFYSLKQYKKREKEIENREIVEKIIQPLEENLKEIIEKLSKGGNSSTCWKWEEIKKKNSILIYKIDSKIEDKIKKFNENWQNFQYQYSSNFHLFQNKLNKILDNCFQQLNFPKPEALQKSEQIFIDKFFLNKTLYNSNLLYGWTFTWSVEKTTEDGFSSYLISINFFELIFLNISPQELINKRMKELQINSKFLEKAKGKCEIRYNFKEKKREMSTIEIKKKSWEEIGDFLRKKINKKKSIKKYKEFLEYIECSREIYNEGKFLKKDLEEYKNKLIGKSNLWQQLKRQLY